MNKLPDNFASFYTNEKLGFDLKLVRNGYEQFKPFFIGKSCLELGPATGYMTQLLVNDFEQLTLVEGSLELLNQIPAYSNTTKIHSLFEDFVPACLFDTIIMNHVLEHIAEPVKLLKRIKQWLHPNGKFIIGVPNANSFHRLAAVKMGLLSKENELNDRDKELGHYRVYDFELLKSHIQEAGFIIIKEGGVFLKFLSNNQIETLLADDVVDAYFKLGEQFKENCAEIYVVVSL